MALCQVCNGGIQLQRYGPIRFDQHFLGVHSSVDFLIADGVLCMLFVFNFIISADENNALSGNAALLITIGYWEICLYCAIM